MLLDHPSPQNYFYPRFQRQQILSGIWISNKIHKVKCNFVVSEKTPRTHTSKIKTKENYLIISLHLMQRIFWNRFIRISPGSRFFSAAMADKFGQFSVLQNIHLSSKKWFHTFTLHSRVVKKCWELSLRDKYEIAIVDMKGIVWGKGRQPEILFFYLNYFG